MNKNIAVYIVTNKYYKVLYTGVTSDLPKRAWQHANGNACSFSSRNKTRILVYYEYHDSMISAIEREKYIKGKSRMYKVDLIKSMNPHWEDLREGL